MTGFAERQEQETGTLREPETVSDTKVLTHTYKSNTYPQVEKNSDSLTILYSARPKLLTYMYVHEHTHVSGPLRTTCYCSVLSIWKPGDAEHFSVAAERVVCSGDEAETLRETT